jgi:hypothetical protein
VGNFGQILEARVWGGKWKIMLPWDRPKFRWGWG